jgi:glucokinase
MTNDPPILPAIGIDVGGTNITAGLLDSDNNITSRFRVDTEADGGFDHVVQRIADAIDQLMGEAGLKPKQIAGVGLGIPGAVDPQTGHVLEAVNLRWTNVDLVGAFHDKADVPITLDNDVNVGIWGEYRRGAARGYDSAIGIFVGTGIGGGLVLNGRLFHGPFGTAGEIGHTILNVHGPHGSRTLEQLASRTAIVNRLHAMLAANAPSSLEEHAGSRWPNVRSKALARALAADDELTVRVLKDAAKVIGAAAANVVTLLSLDCVVLGGGLTEALDDRWIKWVRKAFNHAVFPDHCKQCKVVPSELGDDAGLAGAALLARERLATP